MRTTFAEKWWSGPLMFIIWFCIIVACSRTCSGAEIKIAWEANPAAQNVSYYELKAWEVFGTHEVLVKTTETILHLTELEPNSNYFFAVRAVNVNGISNFSDAITGIPVTFVTLTIQQSHDMSTWTNVPNTPLVKVQQAQPNQYFRLKLETP